MTKRNVAVRQTIPSSDVSYDVRWTRRKFVTGLAGLAGSTGLLGYDVTPAAAEPPLETATIRLVRSTGICMAPQYVAEELLRAEGFTDVQYLQLTGGNFIDMIEEGHADFTMDAAQTIVYGFETHPSVITLAGIHAGCYELFAHGQLRSIRDLKGKTISVYALGGGDHVLLASMLAYVGMDPRKDVNWVVPEHRDTMRLFVEGKADAFMAFPPQPQELREKKIGHTILRTTQDRPWSQYFCCMVTTSREFSRRYPVATKRALRAFLKAADLCAQQPERAARFMADRGIEQRYEVGYEVLKDVPYSRWRDSSPEDSLRFFALRLHEAGMIKSTPQQIIARGADWRFLNELKKELKA